MSLKTEEDEWREAVVADFKMLRSRIYQGCFIANSNLFRF